MPLARYVLRDIKPDNLLLDAVGGSVKLIDFGLVSRPPSLDCMLETVCGSPSYAAPEVTLCIPYVCDHPPVLLALADCYIS